MIAWELFVVLAVSIATLWLTWILPLPKKIRSVAQAIVFAFIAGMFAITGDNLAGLFALCGAGLAVIEISKSR